MAIASGSAVVGEAWIAVRADTSAVEGDIEGGVAQAGETAEAEAAVRGKEAGSALDQGLADGASGLPSLSKEVDRSLGDVESKAAGHGSSIGEKLSSGLANSLGGVSTAFGAVGADAGALGTATDSAAGKMSHASSVASGFGGQMAQVGKLITVGAIGGLAAFTAVSAKAGIQFQSTTATIASSAGISVQAAQSIGQAFLSTGGQTIFTAQQLGSAYAQVAGQLGQMQGHALNATQALGFEKTASDLAEISHTDLNTATGDLATTLQTFSLKASDASAVSTVLYNTSRLTGQSMTSVAGTVDKMRSTMGAAAPSIQQLSGFMLDLKDHGETGRKALSAVNSAVTTLIGTSNSLGSATDKANAAYGTKFQADQAKVTATTNALTAANQKLAAAQANVSADAGTSKEAAAQAKLQAAQDAVTKATAAQSVAQSKLTQLQSTGAQITNTNAAAAEKMGLTVFNAKGQFVGMQSVITQLQPKLAGLTQQQQLQTLSAVFGKSANLTLLNTVLAGPAAFNKATAAVTDHSAAQKAMAAQSQTVQHEMDALKAEVTDTSIAFGQKALPVLITIGKVFLSVAKDILDHKAALIALGAIVAAFVAVYLVNLGQRMVKATTDALSSVSKLVKGIFGIGQPAKDAGDAQDKLASSTDKATSSQSKLADQIDALKSSFSEMNSEAESAAGTLDSFAGSSDAASGSVDGLSTSLSGTAASFGELDAAVGSSDGSLGTLDASATGAAATLGGLDGAAGTADGALASMGASADVGAAGLDAAGAAGDAAAPGILAVSAPILAVVAGVALLAGAIYLVVTHFKTIKDALSDVFNWVSSHWKLLATILSGPFAPVVGAVLFFHNQILGFFKDIVDWITGHWKLLVGIILAPIAPILAAWLIFPKQMKAIVDDVFGFFTGLGKDLLGLISTFEDFGYKAIMAIVHGIEKAGSSLIHSVASLIDKIPGGSLVTGALSSIGSAIGLATGGRVTKPTLAVIGESEPETVIPDSVLRQQFQANVSALGSLSDLKPSGTTATNAGAAGGLGGTVPINLTVELPATAQPASAPAYAPTTAPGVGSALNPGTTAPAAAQTVYGGVGAPLGPANPAGPASTGTTEAIALLASTISASIGRVASPGLAPGEAAAAVPGATTSTTSTTHEGDNIEINLNGMNPSDANANARELGFVLATRRYNPS